MTPRHRKGAAAFTLIEILAVALLMALVAGIAIPNLGMRAAQNTLEEARSLASLFEFARQRAVMTGRPQRVVLDLDQQHYWMEAPRAEPLEPVAARARWADQRELPLEAPRAAREGFTPVVGPAGRGYRPPNGVWIEAVDTAQGRIESDQVVVPFGWDGSTEATVVWVAGDGGNEVRLEIAPLADRLRIERVAP